MSRRKKDSALVMYTADKSALEGDEIIEDADHLLQPRTDGNKNLHRFLMIADGVVRAQSRKIIFTTNLPNIGSIDDALLRPGRCFATIQMRPLVRTQADAILSRLLPAIRMPWRVLTKPSSQPAEIVAHWPPFTGRQAPLAAAPEALQVALST